MNTWLNPYLQFDGTCREAMEFYSETFGGTLEVAGFGEFGGEVPQGAEGRVMHAHLETDDGWTFMASDCFEAGQLDDTGSGSIQMTIGCLPGEADRVRGWFRTLAEGGEVTMELDAQPWGDEFGAVTDRFGISWFFNISVGGAA